MKRLLYFAVALEAAALTIRRRDDHPVTFDTLEDESQRVPNEYIVHLQTGYSFNDHFGKIKLDMPKECEVYHEFGAIMRTTAGSRMKRSSTGRSEKVLGWSWLSKMLRRSCMRLSRRRSL